MRTDDEAEAEAKTEAKKRLKGRQEDGAQVLQQNNNIGTVCALFSGPDSVSMAG